MSRENVETIRRFIDQFNETGEFAWELIDPDVVSEARAACVEAR